MFIDIHVHTRRVLGYPREDGSNYATAEELFAGYDQVGIERACLLPECSPECAHTLQSNEDVLEMAEKYNGRFIPFCNIDPRFINNRSDAPLENMLNYYKKLGCKGIGEVTANLPFLDPMMQNLFRAAEETEMPLTFHLSPFVGYSYGIVDYQGLPQLEETMKRFPKLKFFGHSQTFWAEIGEKPSVADRMGYPKGKVIEGRLPKLMREYPNLYGDLSAGSGCNALKRDREYAIKFLNEFQDRLFFGTDICSPAMPTLRPLAEFLIDLKNSGDISETVFNKIARENAIKVLGL